MDEEVTHGTEAFTIVGPDQAEEVVELPAGLGDIFAEEDESPTVVAADFMIQAFAQQTHAVVHHSEGNPPSDLKRLNEHMERLFEDRFGVSLAEAMGHAH